MFSFFFFKEVLIVYAIAKSIISYFDVNLLSFFSFIAVLHIHYLIKS